jgi:hypothetical protein
MMPLYPDVTVKLVGSDGNAFAIIANVSKALKAVGRKTEAVAWQSQAFEMKSYDALLQRVMELVNVE